MEWNSNNKNAKTEAYLYMGKSLFYSQICSELRHIVVN
jgi:hypothetical protein